MQELNQELEQLKKCFRLMRKCLYVASVVLFSCLCTFGFINIASENYSPPAAYSISQSALYAITTLLQVTAMSFLYCIIIKNFKGDLDREYRLLVICQSIFAISFVIRVILIMLVLYNKWIDFTSDYFMRDYNPREVKFGAF